MTADHAYRLAPATAPDGRERMAQALTRPLAGCIDAAQVAGVVVRTWIDIEAALSPVLGRRGVAALYQRSLHLSGTAQGSLADIQKQSVAAIDFEMLRSAFSAKSDADAVAAALMLMRAFCDLLISLVGTSLTKRLLDPLLIDLQAAQALR